jgi:hypothetical protein
MKDDYIAYSYTTPGLPTNTSELLNIVASITVALHNHAHDSRPHIRVKTGSRGYKGRFNECAGSKVVIISTVNYGI